MLIHLSVLYSPIAVIITGSKYWPLPWEHIGSQAPEVCGKSCLFAQHLMRWGLTSNWGTRVWRLPITCPLLWDKAGRWSQAGGPDCMAGPKGELLPFVRYSEHNGEVQEELSIWNNISTVFLAVLLENRYLAQFYFSALKNQTFRVTYNCVQLLFVLPAVNNVVLCKF